MLLNKDGKFTMVKLKPSLVSLTIFLTGPHYQFRGEGQGMKQALLHLWYPLFQALP